MISVKYALILVVGFVAGASIFASPVPQAIAAIVATDVQCTGCVGANDLASAAVTNSKIATSAVTTGKIADGTITAADLGADSVAASEIKGVNKLIFASCTLTFPDATGNYGKYPCTVTGARPGDQVIATLHSTWVCGTTPSLFTTAIVNNDQVYLNMQANTSCPNQPNTVDVSIIVYS